MVMTRENLNDMRARVAPHYWDSIRTYRKAGGVLSETESGKTIRVDFIVAGQSVTALQTAKTNLFIPGYAEKQLRNVGKAIDAALVEADLQAFALELPLDVELPLDEPSSA